jgi:MSHA biogenesis protein MshP
MISRKQRGGALIVALFLVVVVAGLGAFAIRMGANQQQSANLELMEARVTAAAFSGLEYGSARAQGGFCIAGPVAVALPGPPAGMRNITLTLACQQQTIFSGYQVYDLTARAFSGTYGNPDFTQRILKRRVSNIPPGSW